MTALLLLLPEIIKLMPTVTTGIASLVKFIAAVRTAAKQSGEWTPELEKLFVDALIEKASSDAWKTDAELGQ